MTPGKFAAMAAVTVLVVILTLTFVARPSPEERGLACMRISGDYFECRRMCNDIATPQDDCLAGAASVYLP